MSINLPSFSLLQEQWITYFYHSLVLVEAFGALSTIRRPVRRVVKGSKGVICDRRVCPNMTPRRDRHLLRLEEEGVTAIQKYRIPPLLVMYLSGWIDGQEVLRRRPVQNSESRMATATTQASSQPSPKEIQQPSPEGADSSLEGACSTQFSPCAIQSGSGGGEFSSGETQVGLKEARLSLAEPQSVQFDSVSPQSAQLSPRERQPSLEGVQLSPKKIHSGT